MIELIPYEAKKILETLNRSGFEAYLVGGCVRDLILGKKPKDYDITSNAAPDDIIRIFGEKNTIPTGLKFGTVTVLMNKMPFEITHYRCDGEYTDHRSPDDVSFVSDIHLDLCRRDFTMNAIALAPDGTLIDDFNGISHIKEGKIVCVGNPHERFSEDALRILRAVRFSSELGFEIEKSTSDAIHELAPTLKNISAERIQAELNRILCGKNCPHILHKYCDVIFVFIPELEKAYGFKQYTPYHKFTVWHHTAKAVESIPPITTLRLTMLLHDVAKPSMFQMDEKGVGHFQGHDKAGAEMAETILRRLKYDNKTISEVCTLIRFHSVRPKNDVEIKKMISQIGTELFFSLIAVNRADNSAKNDFVTANIDRFDDIEKRANQLIENGQCFFIKQLAINGNDLKSLGINGKKTGDTLKLLLNLVLEDKIENNYQDLISKAGEIAKNE